MCGIAGTVHIGRAADGRLAQAMAERLRLRGPDDHGVWLHDNVALAHRRLSVVDLSQAGHQPMVSQDGRWSLVYNGEIYNAARLRGSLQHDAWQGSSDTEVLLQSIAELGVAATVESLVGMFAFAAYDRVKQELWLCRDRLGIKPLYYGWTGDTFVFASDIHALRAADPARFSINRSAVATFLRLGYIPGPDSIYQEIHKQTPGTLQCLNTAELTANRVPECRSYWSIRDHAEVDEDIDEHQAQERLHELLRQAVSDRLIADVPLGAFLSGGYDSSLVCALMQEQSRQRIRTFTIGFDDSRYNEAMHAKEIAEHLGTDHTELYVNEQDMLEAISELTQLCDEPFGDVSLLPTFLVCRLAKQSVTVALSGDGGDELFWGYTRYDTAAEFWRKLTRIPGPLRAAAAKTLLHPATQRLARGVSKHGQGRTLDQRIEAIGEMLDHATHQSLYERLLSHWHRPRDICANPDELLTPYNDESHWTLDYPNPQRVALQDTLVYLPDDILTKLDRASMAVSLEARVPLLDHRVVEFVSGLPEHLRKRPAANKYLLRRILDQYLPPSLTERPKMGFGAPLDTWLRGPLREWADSLLDASRLEQQGLLQPGPVRQFWESHLSGQADHAGRLWNVLVLQSWLANAE